MNVKRTFLLVLAVLVLLTGLPVRAAAADNEAETFNIVIVTDCSTSLVKGKNATDEEGYRYEAISMFLNLLPEADNLVSAIVFNSNKNDEDTSMDAMKTGLQLNTDLQTVAGKDAKKALADKIEEVPISGYSDIGTALLVAAQKLEGMTEKNGKDSVIVLFTDGKTKTPDVDMKKYNGVEKKDLPIYAQSVKNGEQAVSIMQKNDITLCGVYLSGKNGDPENSEILDLVRRANNCDESLSAADMEGLYIPVKEASQLADAYKQFFSLITGTENKSFGREYELVIPEVGISDINISILAKGSTLEKSKKIIDETSVTITRQDEEAKPLSGRELSKMLSRGDSYRVYKLQDLEPGVWTIRVESSNMKRVEASLHFNTTVNAQMRVDTAEDAWIKGKSSTVEARLVQDDTPLADKAAYRQYECVLMLKKANVSNAGWQEIPMEYRDSTNSFVCEVTPQEYGDYYAKAVFRCGSAIQVSTKTVEWGVDPHAPEAPEVYTVPLVLSLSEQGVAELDLRSLVQDKEDEVSALNIDVNYNGYPAEARRREDDVLHLDGVLGGDGTMYVTYTDTDGDTAVMELDIQYTNKAEEQIIRTVAGVLVAVAALAVVVVYLWLRRRRGEKLIGELELSIPLDGKSIELNLNADKCLHSNLWYILRNNSTDLKNQADMKNVCAACVEKFLEENKKLLSGISIGVSHDRNKNNDMCRITGFNGPKSVKELDHRDDVAVVLGDRRERLVISYNKYE